MITLYHGGKEIVHSPEIRRPNRTLDFGPGFYLISSESQAKDWVKRRLDQDNVCGYVNIYDFMVTTAKETLNIKIFEQPTDEWLEFVMSNRRNPNFIHDYDIVVGPVANDRVYTAFALYESGTISKEILLHELKTYRLVDQYLFHSLVALDYLRFKSAYKVEK